MFDIGISPWLIFLFVGLIFFKPHDWKEIVFKMGQWAARLNAYIFEWKEYISFKNDNFSNKSISPTQDEHKSRHMMHDTFWVPDLGLKNKISMNPYR